MASIEMANICLNPENELRSDEDWRKKNPKYIYYKYIIIWKKIQLFLSIKVDTSKVAQETAYKLLQVKLITLLI